MGIAIRKTREAVVHSAMDVANEIIERGAREHRVFTHLQIQKLVYYCHGWMLGVHGKPMVTQPIAAWEHGPVIEDLYHKLKRYGRDQVYPISGVRRIPFSDEENGIIDDVMRIYGGFSGGHLSDLTHAVDSPWHQTVNNPVGGEIISNELMQDHFRNRYEAAIAAQQANS